MIRLLQRDPTALGLLAACALFFVLLVLVITVFLLAHHRVSVKRENRLRADVRAVAAFLATRILDRDRAAEAIAQACRRWGAGAVVIVLRRIRQAVRGDIAVTISTALEEIGVVADLARQAASGSRGRRIRALRLLGQCGGHQARAVLLPALDDGAPEIRRAAREALPAIRDDRSLRAALTSYLRDPAQRSAWRLHFFSKVAAHTPGSLRAMVSLGVLETNNEKLALEALTEVGDPLTLPLAVARLNAESPELRTTAVRAVGKLQEWGGVERLLPRLRDPEWIVRAAAARALGSSQCDALACDELAACLGDPVWWVRANAAHTLAHQGEIGALALLEALQAGDSFARESALAALALIDPEVSLPPTPVEPAPAEHRRVAVAGGAA